MMPEELKIEFNKMHTKESKLAKLMKQVVSWEEVPPPAFIKLKPVFNFPRRYTRKNRRELKAHMLRKLPIIFRIVRNEEAARNLFSVETVDMDAKDLVFKL